MIIRSRIMILSLFLVVFGFLFSSRADADIKPGVRAGAYFDAGGFFIGGDVLARIADRWYINPNLEYVFGDGADLFSGNFDIHYDLPMSKKNLYVWVGGGLAIIHTDPDNDRIEGDTDPGLNLLMGVGFPFGGGNVFYIQPKAIISDNSDFSLAFGVRF
jgi:hypothetical protein